MMELGDFISDLDSAMWWAGMAVRQGWYALTALLGGDPDTARVFASGAWNGLMLHRQVWVTMLIGWLGVVATALGILKGWGWWMLVPALFLGWFLVALAVAVWFNMLPLLLVVMWAAVIVGAITLPTVRTRRTKRR